LTQQPATAKPPAAAPGSNPNSRRPIPTKAVKAPGRNTNSSGPNSTRLDKAPPPLPAPAPAPRPRPTTSPPLKSGQADMLKALLLKAGWTEAAFAHKAGKPLDQLSQAEAREWIAYLNATTKGQPHIFKS